MANRIHRFTQQMFGFAENVAELGGGIYRAQAQTQLEKAELEIAQESLRFRDALSKDQNPDTWINDEGGAGSQFDQYRERLQGIIDTTLKNPLARSRGDVLMGKYLLEDEAIVRSEKNKKLKETLGRETAANMEATWALAANPAELLTKAPEVYQAKKQELVFGSGLITEKEFDDLFMGSISGYVTDIYMAGIQKAIDEGGARGKGLEAAMDAVDKMPSIEFSPTAAFRATPEFKDKMKGIAAQTFENVRKAREEGYEEDLVTSLTRRDIGGIRKIISDHSPGGFVYWADAATREHWANVLENMIEDEKSDSKEEETPFWEMYYTMYNNGASYKYLREYLLDGASRGLVPQKDVTAKLDSTFTDVVMDQEMRTTYARIDDLAKTTKDKKATITMEQAGRAKEFLRDYFQAHRKDKRPGEIGLALDAFLAEPLRADMAKDVSKIVRGEAVTGGALTLDPWEKMQAIIQSGIIDGKVRNYDLPDMKGNPTGNLVLTGPYADSRHLEALHVAQRVLAARDFGVEAEKAMKSHIWVQGASGPDDLIHSGQLLLEAPDGEIYTYLIPEGKHDEELYHAVLDDKGGISWEILKTSPGEASAAAAKKAKREETIEAVKGKAQAAIAPVQKVIDVLNEPGDWLRSKINTKKAKSAPPAMVPREPSGGIY